MKYKFNKFIFSIPIFFISMFLFYNPVKAQYVNNYAASFNGTNSYVSVPSHSDLQPTTAITVEAWIYPTALPLGSACIIGKNYLTSYYLGIESTGRFSFFPRNHASGFLTSRVTGTVKVNQWNHIAGTYDGTTTRLYLNGVLDTSRTGITGAVGSNSDSLYIGCDRVGGTSALFFNGRLDNVRIWKSARTNTEILNNMFIPLNVYQDPGVYASLMAGYTLDNSAADNCGTIFNNGNVRNISYVNYNNKTVNHIDYNNNLVFNGSTDYCSHYNILGDYMNPTTKLTLECWIKRDTTGTQRPVQHILNKSGSSLRYNYGLFIYPTGEVIFAINSGNLFIRTVPLITNAQWTHIACTYNSSTGNAVIYLNGDSAYGETFAGNPVIQNNNDSVFFGGIGASAFAADRFKGQLDEVRIWKSVRTKQQIRDNMYKHANPSGSDSVLSFDFDWIHTGLNLDKFITLQI